MQKSEGPKAAIQTNTQHIAGREQVIVVFRRLIMYSHDSSNQVFVGIITFV